MCAVSQKPWSRGETAPLALGQDEGAVNQQGRQGRHQGPQDLDGIAPVEEQKDRHQGPVEQQQGIAEDGHRQVAVSQGSLDEDQGVARQAAAHNPGAIAAKALPLDQEESQPQDGGPEVSRQGQVE